MHDNVSGATKAVCYREVSTIRGVCYKRFHSICALVYSIEFSVLISEGALLDMRKICTYLCVMVLFVTTYFWSEWPPTHDPRIAMVLLSIIL